MKDRRHWLGLTRSRGALVAVGVVVVILVAQLAVSIAAAVVADRGTAEAASDTYSYIGDLMSERVAGFTDAASDVVRGTAAEITRAGELPTPDELTPSIADRLSREPNVKSVFVGAPNGAVFALVRVDGGFQRLDLSETADGGTVIVTTLFDEDLAEVGSTVEETDFRLGDRPWYRLAIAADTIVWTNPYVSARDGDLVISPAQAARAQDSSRVLAVVGADLDLDSLGALLDDIPIGEDAQAFILTGDGRVVAAPQGERGRLQDAVDAEGRAPRAAELGLPTAVPAPSPGDALQPDDDTVRLERSLDPETGLDWILLLEANAEDLSPGLLRFQHAAYWIAVVSLVVVAGAIIFALRMWAPVWTMRQHASTDALTGLANRYEFQRRARALVAASAADRDPVLVITLDLDELKLLNDTLGHDAGDIALAAVGDMLLESVRTRDVAARMGGDEFAVVMRLGDRGSPVEVTRRLRDHVDHAIHDALPAAVFVGVTAGFATTHECGYDLRTLLAMADDALVSGKRVHKGRSYPAGHAASKAGHATVEAQVAKNDEPSTADTLPGN